MSEIDSSIKLDAMRRLVKALETIDVVPVIRCKECKFKQKCPTKIFDEHTDDWFCADGEVKNDGN